MFVITSTENKLKESKDTDHHQSSTPFPSPTDDAIHQPPSSSTSTSHPEPFIIFSTPHAPPASEMLHLRLSHSSSNSHQSQSQPEYQDFHVSRTLLFQIPWFAKERSKIERHFHLHAHSHPHPLAGNPHPYPGYPHRSFSGLSIHSKASSHNPSHSNAHSSSSHDESQVQAQAEQQVGEPLPSHPILPLPSAHHSSTAYLHPNTNTTAYLYPNTNTPVPGSRPRPGPESPRRPEPETRPETRARKIERHPALCDTAGPRPDPPSRSV